MYNNGNSATGNRAVSKLLVVLLSVAICAAFMPLLSDSADAAGKKPAKVKSVTVKVSSANKVSVSWKKAKKAKKYEVQVNDTKSGLVASKKVKGKKYSFKGQYDTKYIVKVRGIKGKKTGKWSAKKSVTTNKASTAAQKAAEEKAAAAEKAAAEAKAAQAAAEKATAEAKAEAEKAAAEAQAVAEKAAKEAEQAQKAADIVKAIEKGNLSDDEILELKKAYDELSDEAKGNIPVEVVQKLQNKADKVDRKRANAFLKEAVKLSPAKILDECDSWDKGEVEDYTERVNNAIDTFRNELTPNQQMLVGFEISNRLDACLFALEKADSIVGLNERYNDKYLAETYFDAEVGKIGEILNGKTNDEIVETGAIDKIKAAENSEQIETIVKETDDAIGEIATKPEVVTAAIEKLSTDYAKITEDNIGKARDGVAAIEEQIAKLTWKQKKEVENFDKLVSVVNKITAFGLANDAAAAKAELEREAVNYYDGEWTEVKGMITDGKAAIDVATTPEEISAALAEALDKIDAVKTKIGVVRAEIEECVETYLDNLSDENIEDARKAVNDATEKYDNDLNDDQRTEVYAAEDGLENDVDELLDQVENYDLNNAKDAAKAELENYAVEDAYFERAWGQVSYEIEKGIEAIELAETEKAVEEALANAEKAIDAIPTKPVVVTKRISRLYKDYNEKGLSIDNYSEMKERAESIREMFEGLTEEEQAAVENIDELETVEAAIGREAGTIAAEIENKIEAINDVKDIVKGRKIVFNAVEAYYSVDEDVQALVSNHDVLKNALDRLEVEWPDSITVRILALYDTADKYGALTPEEQEKYDAELIAVRAELEEYDQVREKSGINNRVVKKYRKMLKSIHEEG